jgi:hypothetical protein
MRLEVFLNNGLEDLGECRLYCNKAIGRGQVVGFAAALVYRDDNLRLELGGDDVSYSAFVRHLRIY